MLLLVSKIDPPTFFLNCFMYRRPVKKYISQLQIFFFFLNSLGSLLCSQFVTTLSTVSKTFAKLKVNFSFVTDSDLHWILESWCVSVSEGHPIN